MAVTTPQAEVSSTPAQRSPLLKCSGVCKHFGAVEALVDVDFEVYAGEVVALVGDNGGRRHRRAGGE